MFKLNGVRISALLFSVIILLNACRKKDTVVQEPDNLVNFEAAAQGITAAEASIVIKVKLSRATNVAIPVTLNLTPEGLVFGTDFTTTPQAVSGSIPVTIPSGSSEATITVAKVAGALFDGDEKLVIDIFSSGEPVIIGSTKQLTLSFSELVASAATATIEGGGPTYPNKVFVDLSSSRQTAVLRTNWDLGFYTGDANDFRVTLNSSVNMMAKQINKNSLADVSTADTIGFSTDVVFSQENLVTTAMAYIDHPSGDLTRTAIAEVSATAGDNKVYIVNRGNGVSPDLAVRGWKKIRVTREGNGYKVQYADIAATTFQEITISKDDAYFFKYVSLETNNIVPVEPQKTKWDIAWTYFANATNFGGGEVPYLFQDVIIKNRNVEIVKVMTATKAFDAFAEADLTGLTWSTSQVSIGSDWRAGGGPGIEPSVRGDRYYIVKDGDGNYYKLRFTAILDQDGKRGRPAYEVVLVKEG